MNLYQVLVFCLASLTICQAASTTTVPMPTKASTTLKHTHRPHTTREPLEHGSITFHYLRDHNMIVKAGDSCYVVTLSADEQVAVHTDSGLIALEIKIVSMLSSATVVTKDALEHLDARACGHVEHFYTLP